MAEQKEKLFEMFPPVSSEEWHAKVDADLKGVPFEKKLVWRTNEGFNVNPMYRREDIADLKTTNSLPGEYPFVRGTRTDNNWLVRQEIIAGSPAEANAKALDVLGKGVTSLGFHVSDVNAETVSTLLEGINLSEVEINLSCCHRKAEELTKVLTDYIKAHNAESTFHGSIKFNPWKRDLKKGKKSPVNAAGTGKKLIELAAGIPGLHVLSVDSAMLTNSGAYIYQELGYALAWGAEWLTLLTDAGLTVDDIAPRIKFDMGVGTNYFMELAKFRAARMLWAQIVKQYNPSADSVCKMTVHAETSRFNQTVYDAHVNLLRSQTEAMSAALAGVDSITVTPFDTPYKTPDEFSERIARNQQHLLKEESHLDKVVDPAGGSYYVETLTASIAAEAWKLFLGVEAEGGFAKAVEDGKIQAAVNESNAKRHADMARRKEILLGTNQYPNINEMAAEKLSTLPNAHTAAAVRTKKAKMHSTLPVRHLTSNSCVWPPSMRQTVQKYSCSPSAIWPCVWPALSSPAISSDAQAMRSSTTTASRQSKTASTQPWHRQPTLWFSARRTTNTPNTHPPHLNISTDVQNSL